MLLTVNLASSAGPEAAIASSGVAILVTLAMLVTAPIAAGIGVVHAAARWPLALRALAAIFTAVVVGVLTLGCFTVSGFGTTAAVFAISTTHAVALIARRSRRRRLVLAA